MRRRQSGHRIVRRQKRRAISGKETELLVHYSLSLITRRALRNTAFAVGAAGMFLMSALPLAAQAPDASDIAEGARLFRQKGNCQSCHGWAGDGRKMDSQMPDGANLRETRLDRAALIMTIKCGLPSTGMPPFDKFAYSDGRCYGLKKADLAKAGQRMSDPPETLQNREIEFIADFMFAKIIGKGPMDHAKCVAFWGEEIDACAEFPK
jgi:mono/diheme cytochrome c family protein